MKKLLSRIWQQPSRARKQSTVKRVGEGSPSRKPRTYIPLRNCTKMGVVLPIKAPKQPPPLGSCTGNKADILQFDAHRGVMASFVISVWFVGENVKTNQLAPDCDICSGDGKTRILCQPIRFLVVIP